MHSQSTRLGCSRAFYLALIFFVSATISPGQTLPGQPDKLEQAIAAVKEGNAAVVEPIVAARATQAIPALESGFDVSKDILAKAQIASGLIRLGDIDSKYWQFLLKQATFAVESDMPDIDYYDAEGKLVRNQRSPTLIAWAKAHALPEAQAAHDAQRVLPGIILMLAVIGDRRAIPVFRRGLLSPNYLVQAFSAKGLAEIQDQDSIPMIIEACKKAPSDLVSNIAESLIYFDDPSAQSAADTFLPKNETTTAYREERRRKGAHAFTPY